MKKKALIRTHLNEQPQMETKYQWQVREAQLKEIKSNLSLTKLSLQSRHTFFYYHLAANCRPVSTTPLFEDSLKKIKRICSVAVGRYNPRVQIHIS